MLDATNPSELEPDDGASAAPAWHGEMLRELAELGMRMARAVTVGAEMRAQAGEASAADEAASSLALQRAAKMVRLTVALDKKLLEAPREANDPAVDYAAQQREDAEASVRVRGKLWKLVGRPMVGDAVERAIESETEGEARERLFAELHERLTESDEALALTGPGQYEGLIVQICKELGLSGERRRSAYAKALAGGRRTGGDPAAPRDVSARPQAKVHPPP